MSTIDKRVIDYVSLNMEISFDEAKQALNTDDKVFQILFSNSSTEHYPIEADLKPELVNVKSLAENLNLDTNRFKTFVDEGLIWVMYGDDIAEDIAGQGLTPIHATADFYRRWYISKIKKGLQASPYKPSDN